MQSEALYDDILSRVENHTGIGSTFLSTLNSAGKKLFKEKFHGVYPSDMVPQLSKTQPYCILNCDKSDMPGSHWVAMCYKTKKTSLFYDSFGRKPEKIIPAIVNGVNGRIESTEKDAEQHMTESNCGARCLAWLIVCDQCGLNAARYI